MTGHFPPTPSLERVVLSLGSNVGDRYDNLMKGIDAIARIPSVRVVARSPFYDTEPVGVDRQENFLNGVIVIETDLPPHTLLEECQRIETEIFQRVRSDRPLPRRLDIDIIFFGDRIIRDDRLTIPHPRAHERRFVLLPLADIAPALRHPLRGTTIADLLRLAPENQQVKRLPPERT
ncbi:MAG: 2-amino-4-hydroxy-6-hydroxymethyldihydropteridine diphosphokinase [Desulfuromonadia bacterium]